MVLWFLWFSGSRGSLVLVVLVDLWFLWFLWFRLFENASYLSFPVQVGVQAEVKFAGAHIPLSAVFLIRYTLMILLKVLTLV